MEIKKLDLFSGIGGFPLGFEKAGFKIVKHYYSEVDKHCIANYTAFNSATIHRKMGRENTTIRKLSNHV